MVCKAPFNSVILRFYDIYLIGTCGYDSLFLDQEIDFSIVL